MRQFLILCGLVYWLLALFLGGMAHARQHKRTQPDKSHPIFQQIESTTKAFFQQGGYPGMSVGVVVDQKLVWSTHLGFADVAKKRRATGRTLYRIGSISKVFTTTMLAMLRDAGKLRLDDPLGQYLPKGAVLPTDPRGAPAITLRHLATHTSGLASLPPNLKGAPGDAYNGFSEKDLLQGAGQMVLDYPIGARYSYSNMGMTLLGVAMAHKIKRSYPALLQELLLRPLQMTDTCIVLTPKRKQQLAIGYGPRPPHRPMKPWDVGVFQPAAGIVSSLRDMARWLALQHRAGTAIQSPIRGGTLHELHALQRLMSQDVPGVFRGGVGLGWHVFPIKQQQARIVFHNGGVAGFRSFLGFSPLHKMGVIVLTNSFRSADQLGFKLMAMLAKAFPQKDVVAPSENLRLALKRLCAAIVAKPPTEQIKALFSTVFLQHLPVSNIKAMLGGIYGQMGTCQHIAWHPTQRARVSYATITFSKGQALRALIGLSPSRQGKLVMLQLKPVSHKARRTPPQPVKSSLPSPRRQRPLPPQTRPALRR